MTTTVKLLTHTAYPVESLYANWQQSRTDEPVETARVYHELSQTDVSLRDQITKTFQESLAMRLPVMQGIYFTWLLEGVPVSLREQLVRHRVGHKFGEQLGSDLIPDHADSSYWSQTMRVRLMDKFATNDQYFTPQSIKDCKEDMGDGTSMEEFYHVQMKWIQSAYRRLLKAGIPPEDARQLIPLGATHRMTWTCSLSALAHLLEKRSCWIAQLGLWEPVVRGIVSVLEQFHVGFRVLINPPCFDAHNNWTGCKYRLENHNRCKGSDPGLPCSLYLNRDEEGRSDSIPDYVNDPSLEKQYIHLKQAYGSLWRRDPMTGVPL